MNLSYDETSRDLKTNDESASVREIKHQPNSTSFTYHLHEAHRSCGCFGSRPIKRQHSAARESVAEQ